MRISDDRYNRDLVRLNLALRFIRHEARTHTIRAWTGLTDDRIRKLYRSYLDGSPLHIPRHRGRSPQQASFFVRSQRLQQETAWLASLLYLLGVVPAHTLAEAAGTLPGMARAESLCQAFEAYRALVPSPRITFEHAVFLVTVLTRGDELRLRRCGECGSFVVMDRFPLRIMRCHHCDRPVSHGAAVFSATPGAGSEG